jgi:hypothetical protein
VVAAVTEHFRELVFAGAKIGVGVGLIVLFSVLAVTVALHAFRRFTGL